MNTLNILFEVTVYSAVIFTAIMLLKSCFKHKMSPFLHYVVWFVLVLRLMMPLTIASPVRLFVVPPQSEIQVPIEQSQPQAYNPVNAAVISEPIIANTQPQTAVSEAYVPGKTLTTTVTTQTPPAFALPQILTIVWLAGTGLCLAYLASLYALLRRKLKRNASSPSKALMALFEETKTEMGIKANIKLVCMYEYGTPSLMFPRTIMMPADALVAMDEEQTRFALRHELMHYRRGDHVMNILLSLLNAVYWFNPFIWLAFHHMREDMETACDSKVVKALNASAKTRYASLILSLSARPAHRQLVLGMSHSNARKSTEKRVKGIFMKGESRMSVKLISVLLTVALIFTCFTTACQPVTANNQVKVPKLSDSYKTSEHWSETISGDKINIVINADVSMPNADKYPVTRLQPATFTQQRVDELVNYFAKGKQLYLPHVMTKADYQKQLDESKQGELVNGVYVDTDNTINDIKYLEEKQASAPEDSPLINTDSTLTYEWDYETGKQITTGSKNWLNVIFDNGNGGDSFISIVNSTWGGKMYNFYEGYNAPASFSYFVGGYEDFGITESMYNDMLYWGETEEEDGYTGAGVLFDKIKVTPEEAIAEADKVIGDLSIKHMMLVSAEKYVTTNVPEKSGYELKYARESGGIPLCWHMWGSRFTGEKPPEYSPPLPEETLTVRISKDGLESLLWTGCAEALETVSENTELLQFEEIKQKLKDRLVYKYSFLQDGLYDDFTLTVTSAELRMGYIGVKDTSKQALMVPVWVFTVEEKYTWKANGKTEPGNIELFMLNAMDGGAIEYRGYH